MKKECKILRFCILLLLALSAFQGTGQTVVKPTSQQLNQRLKEDGIYVGTLTINAMVMPTSATHSPVRLAQAYWDMFQNTTEVEVVI